MPTPHNDLNIDDVRLIEIEVTQEDLDQGERHCAVSCPIALAVKRQTSCDEVAVYNNQVELTNHDEGGDPESIFSFFMPGWLRTFVDQFDHGTVPDLPPTTFINIPRSFSKDD